jgi:uncharacterized membrane protein YjdF
MQPHSHKTPFMLLTIYIILFATFAINPYDRTTWWAKNIPILIVVGVFAYPVVEISVRKKWVSNNLMAWLLGVFALGF